MQVKAGQPSTKPPRILTVLQLPEHPRKVHPRHRQPHVQLARIQLRDRRLLVRDLAPLLHRNDPVADKRLHLRLDCALCQLCPQSRVRHQLRFHALLRPRHEVSHDQLVGHTCGDPAALEVKRRGSQVPAPVLLPEQRVGRDAHILEIHLIEFVAAQHVHQRAHADTRRFHVNQEVADPPVLRCVRISARNEDAHVRTVRAAGPDLLAIDNVIVPIADRPRLQACKVAPRPRFTEELTPLVLAADDSWQVAFLLFLGPGNHDRRARPPVTDPAGSWRTLPGELLAEDELFLHAQATAAMLLRPRRRAPTAPVELLRPAT